jgi:hypothetical protein
MQVGMHAVLTRIDFEDAVKQALRQYTRADLLTSNPLLRARIVEHGAPGAATVQDLRDMLVETAETLFGNERDQKLYRVLHLTYLNPAPKQEAAADRLGLPFSRRHLTMGVRRITDWLWERERKAPEATPVSLSTSGTEEAAPPIARRPPVNRCIAVPEPVAGSGGGLPRGRDR